jgi:hypothetical protein
MHSMTHNSFLFIQGGITANGNYITFRHKLEDFLQGKFQLSLGYNYTEYTLPEGKLNILQNTGEMSLFWLFSKKMSFSSNYEGTFEKHDKYSRVYLMIRKRF